MGQLQKRFEQHAQGQFSEDPQKQVTWKPEASGKSESNVHSLPLAPRWQIRGLQIGLIIIVTLLAILIFV